MVKMSRTLQTHSREPFKCGCGYEFHGGYGFHWCPFDMERDASREGATTMYKVSQVWPIEGMHQPHAHKHYQGLRKRFRSFVDAAIEVLWDWHNADEE